MRFSQTVFLNKYVFNLFIFLFLTSKLISDVEPDSAVSFFNAEMTAFLNSFSSLTYFHVYPDNILI